MPVSKTEAVLRTQRFKSFTLRCKGRDCERVEACAVVARMDRVRLPDDPQVNVRRSYDIVTDAICGSWNNLDFTLSSDGIGKK